MFSDLVIINQSVDEMYYRNIANYGIVNRVIQGLGYVTASTSASLLNSILFSSPLRDKR